MVYVASELRAEFTALAVHRADPGGMDEVQRLPVGVFTGAENRCWG